ncbi:cation-transporting ATPase pma1 [Xylaria intraflava]|nr:cation-transporting ATPase pma1 [Xylaria intraflava]
MAGDGEPDPEAAATTGPGARIAFEDGITADQQRTGREAGREAGSRRNSRSSRSLSRHRTGNRLPYSELQIEYRTLSIHVSDSKDINSASNDLKSVNKDDDKKKADEYFANLDYHVVGADEICQRFNVDQNQGLSLNAAANRLKQNGENTLPKTKSNQAKKIFWYIFGGFCSILWIGVIVFFLCWQPLSSPPSVPNLALAILVIIVILLQASFSAFQDWSTTRTMRSIMDLVPSEAVVRREGQFQKVKTAHLVPGDIVQLHIGDKVPADLRLLNHSGDIRFDRAILTGESDEVEGSLDCTHPAFLESRNIALLGTVVVNGGGTGVVVLTGANSVMGRIAQATTGVREVPTLIQKEISRFVRIIVVLTALLAALILFTWVGWLRRDHYAFLNVVQILNDVLSTVVAFIPEGMPVGVALTLMMVARRMKDVNVLPKGLSTVETLGCVTVICSDKTGTLTRNEMRVSSVAFVDQQLDSPDKVTEALSAEKPEPHFSVLHRAALLSNDAFFDPTSAHLPPNERVVQGNATDAAILRFVAATNPSLPTAAAKPHRDFEIPFNSKNKWMLAMFRSDESGEKGSEYQVYIKGAPDVLLRSCTKYWSAKTKTVKPMDSLARSAFNQIQDKLSRNAERVLVICEKTVTMNNPHGSNAFSDEIKATALEDLTVIGIFGIVDPPRPEAAQTVQDCRRAGVRFFMVTGDYGLTATAIARNIGIFSSDIEPDSYEVIRSGTNTPNELKKHREEGTRRSLVLEGPSVALLDDDEWDVVCEYEEIVFARTTPEQKLRIVNELRQRDNVVAVTGDGVNDAPALRAADVGVAIGNGSDVAIDASDLVLLGDFSSITTGIRLGRLVFQNLQKLISYLLPAGSWSEIWPVLVNVFFGVPLPLSSFLMIIICVFTDLFCALSLIMEKEEFDLLSIPPRHHKRDHLITLKVYVQAYLFIGFLETVSAHAMFFLYMWRHAGIPIHELFFLFEGYSEGFHGYTTEELAHFNTVGQGVYFVTLVILQWGNILSVRNRRLSIFQADPFTKKRRNPWLIGSVLISLAIAVFVTQEPGLQYLFQTASVPIEHWLIPIPLAVGILALDELRKLMVRLFPKGPIARIAW